MDAHSLECLRKKQKNDEELKYQIDIEKEMKKRFKLNDPHDEMIEKEREDLA